MIKLARLKSSLTVAPGIGLAKAPPVDSWRGSKTSARRGYGGKWQRERLRFLEAHPLCRYCDAKGIVTLATVVDHVTPHRGDKDLFWNRENWQAMCRPCHDSEKRREEARQTPGGKCTTLGRLEP